MKQRYLALVIASIGISTSASTLAQSAQVAQVAQSAFQVSNNQSIGDTLKNYRSLAPLVLNNGQPQTADGNKAPTNQSNTQNPTGNTGSNSTGGTGVSHPGGNVLNNMPGYASGAISTVGGNSGGSVGSAVGAIVGGSTVGNAVGGIAGGSQVGGVVNGSPSYGNVGGIVNGGIAGSNNGGGFTLENIARGVQVIGGAVGGKAGTIAVGIGGAVGTYNSCGGITSGEGVTVNCAMNMATTATSIYAATHQDSKGAQNAARVLGVVNGSGLVQNISGMQNDQYIGETDSEYALRKQAALPQYGSPNYVSQANTVYNPSTGAIARDHLGMPITPQYDDNGNLMPAAGAQPAVMRDPYVSIPTTPQFDDNGNPLNVGAAQPTRAASSTAGTVKPATPRTTPGATTTAPRAPVTGSAWDVPQKNAISVSSSEAANQALMMEQSKNIVAAQQTYRNAVSLHGVNSSEARSAQMAIDGLSKAYSEPYNTTPGMKVSPSGGW